MDLHTIIIVMLSFIFLLHQHELSTNYVIQPHFRIYFIKNKSGSYFARTRTRIEGKTVFFSTAQTEYRIDSFLNKNNNNNEANNSHNCANHWIICCFIKKNEFNQIGDAKNFTPMNWFISELHSIFIFSLASPSPLSHHNSSFWWHCSYSVTDN